MLMIGDFSKLSRISIQMLRHYDQIGLLIPAFVDQSSGYRYYLETQLPAANKIRAMKEMGLGLGTIKELMDESDEGVIGRLEQHSRTLQDEISIMSTRLHLTRSRIMAVRDGADSARYDVSLKEIPGMPVMCCRGILKHYEQEGELWSRLFAEMAVQKAKRFIPSYQIAIFHNDGYMEEDIDVEVQCAVDRIYADGNGVSAMRRDSVTAATVICQGDYSRLADVNTAIAGWMALNGWRLCGPGFNIYHVSPGDTDCPEQMVTEVCFPVAPEAEKK